MRQNRRVIIPTLVTLFALAISFIALHYIMIGDYTSAAYFMVFATIIDLADGTIARRLNATSEMGKQLDSLSDAIGAGLVPSALLYRVFFVDWGIPGLLISFLPLAAAVFRLARYNTLDKDTRQLFCGLPAPMGTATLVISVVFMDAVWGEYRFSALIALLTVIVSLLMISSVRYETSFFITSARIFTTWQGIICVLIVSLFIVNPSYVMFPLGVITITSGLIRHLKESSFRGRRVGLTQITNKIRLAIQGNWRVILPGCITLFAMFSAFTALQNIMRSNYLEAGWLIFFALTINALNRGLLRYLNTNSDMVNQLDSLSDAISAGLVTGMLIYEVYFADWGFGGLLLSFLPASMTVLRLAQFNVSVRGARRLYWGLLSTAAANMLVSFVILSDALWGEFRYAGLVAAMAIFVSILIICNVHYEIPYSAHPSRTFENWRGSAVLLLLALFVVSPAHAYFVLVISLIAVGLFRYMRKMYSAQFS
jgi:CDP-diacylglycerol---serine O-phosphatidyltransferase